MKFEKRSQNVSPLVAVFEEETLPGDPSVIIVAKIKWMTQLGGQRLIEMKLPAQKVIIAHTATSNCSTRVLFFMGKPIELIQTRNQIINLCLLIERFNLQEDCISNVRSVQDREYNFLVGGDGAIYEGSGWFRVGKHTKKYLNAKSICFAFIGSYNGHLPSPHQIEVVKKMIVWGVKEKKLLKNYQLHAQCQLVPTDSPGATLIDEIKIWDNYSDCKKKSRRSQNNSSVKMSNHLCC